MWRLQVHEKLTKRQQTELRLALYWLDGLPVDKKEALVGGEVLRIKVVDAVISVLRHLTPHIPLDAEALEPPAPSSTTESDDTPRIDHPAAPAACGHADQLAKGRRRNHAAH